METDILATSITHHGELIDVLVAFSYLTRGGIVVYMDRIVEVERGTMIDPKSLSRSVRSQIEQACFEYASEEEDRREEFIRACNS